MGFLRKLFGGGGNKSSSQDRYAMFFYIRPKRCDEIVMVRINLMNDPSQLDHGKGYFVRKVASATRCPFQAELEVTFDARKRVTQTQVTDGELVDEAEYNAWLAEKDASP